MKKLILSCFFIINYLFATDYQIICSEDLTYTSGSPFMDWFYYGSFYDEDVQYTANLYEYPFMAFDSSSPVCGGNGEQNMVFEMYCDGDSVDCYDGIKANTITGLGFITPSDSGYETTVTQINGMYPCVDFNIDLPTTLTHSFYDDDVASQPLSSDYRYGQTRLTHFNNYSQYGDTLTSEEAKQLREVCTPPDPNAEIDYTGLLNQIITNTAPNSDTVSKLTNIDNRQQSLEDTLNQATVGKDINTILDITDDKTSFTTTFENTLTTSYDTYSDVFGFGGYGSAPAPISFTMFNKNYVVFDIANIGADNIDLIRNTFLMFSYLFGFIMVFKGN